MLPALLRLWRWRIFRHFWRIFRHAGIFLPYIETGDLFKDSNKYLGSRPFPAKRLAGLGRCTRAARQGRNLSARQMRRVSGATYVKEPRRIPKIHTSIAAPEPLAVRQRTPVDQDAWFRARLVPLRARVDGCTNSPRSVPRHSSRGNRPTYSFNANSSGDAFGFL